MAEEPTVAESSAYRRRSALERMGAAVGRALPAGRVREWLRDAYRAALGAKESRLPGGERVRLLAEYRFVTWNPAEYEAFRAAARPGAVALDVGANVGAYALLMGEWVRPGGRVFAFEPAPDAFAGLSRHVALNGLGEVVTPVRAAVAATSGRAALLADGIAGTNRLSSSGEGGGAMVETVSLDEFCAREGIAPALIKVDVEGAELEVLRGARETLRRVGSGLELFVEMHPTLWREAGI
ncbi:MAG TPA: FkbM family methyltransferase, partial [Longimicrobium sp.]|nr:FkbM family methyltransferase [Longimicrobium sp.]